MMTAPSGPLEIGHLVCRRTAPLDTAEVGVVGGLLFHRDGAVAIVRWHLGPSTFEPEATLVQAFRLRP
jgi:hypothetical protein